MAESSSPSGASHPVLTLDWTQELQFAVLAEGSPAALIDGDGRAAPSPVNFLLASLASCAATDVLIILGKQRTPATHFSVRIEALRATQPPRRLLTAVLHFHITAHGATAEKVERAVHLSVEKYCSVRSSLAADIPVSWTIDLNPSRES